MSGLSVSPFIKEFYPEYYKWETYPAEQCVPFTKVDLPWGILGNFARTPIVVDGVTFRNSEQLFQLMKFRDKAILMDIYSKANPKMTAKKTEYRPFRREDWGRMIVDAIKFCMQKKYEQHEEFRKELARTEGKYIVEDQTSSTRKKADTWGAKLHDGIYEGSNLMGRLLMELRDNGKLEYHLPDDALDFIEIIKQGIRQKQ